ncbi:C4-dicarboxylate TRAP transporter substrate-binding protein [Lampropedia aestuarii]|nr:C4-dicarboxylate TRAP transporter substrate-binding protein [Lampropedia aestuarii]
MPLPEFEALSVELSDGVAHSETARMGIVFAHGRHASSNACVQRLKAARHSLAAAFPPQRLIGDTLMTRLKQFFALTALAVCALAATSATAQTKLRYAVGFPSGAAPEAARVYADAVKQLSNNSINVRVFDMSLLNLAEMSSGLKQGLADIGYVLTPYTPAEFPHLNMASELSMLLALEDDPDGRSGMAFGGAMAEFVFTACPECNGDFARENQVFTGAGGSSPYMLLCTKPMQSADDLKGARLRAGGAAWARWARKVEAQPVSMPGNEIFEAMKQNVVECTIQSAPELSGLNLSEVTTSITPNLPGGAFSGASTNINRDVWRKLSEEQRRSLLKAGALMNAEVTYRYFDYAKRDVEAAVAKGVQLQPADAALLAISRAAIEADIPNLAATYAKQHNVQRGDALIEAMRPLLVKWTKLVEPVDSAQTLADLYWNEVYSKVDVSQHGLQ